MNKTASKNQLEILRLLADPKNTQASEDRIASSVGITQQRVSTILKSLEEKGLVEIDKSPKLINIKRLTRQGYKTATCGGEVVSLNTPSDSREKLLRIHRFIGKFEIQNPSELKGPWVERYFTSKPVRHRYNPENKCYEVFSEDYTFRISNSNVFIHLHELRGDDGNTLKNRAWLQLLQAKDWLENNGPIELTSSPNEIEAFLNEQHIAILKDPLALMVENSEKELNEVKICDNETGEVRLKIDKSTGVPELESENIRYGEEDIKKLKDFYDYLIHGGKERIKEGPERIDKLGERVENIEDRPAKTTLSKELTFSSKWVDNHGNLMGYSTELEKPVKIIPKEEI